MTLFRPLVLLALLCLLVVLAYWPGLSGGYAFDDFPNIVHNDGLHIERLGFEEVARAAFSSGSGPLSRPLSMAGFAVERHLFGLDPFPMKLTNVIIHVGNVVLVFLLLRVLLDVLQRRHPKATTWVVSPQSLALLVAAAWALAPINLTSVLYVVQRMESLAALFMLAGLLAYVHGRCRIEAGQAARGWSWVLGGLLGGLVLSGLAKETAAMLPLHALLIEWLVFGFGQAGPTRRRLCVLYAVILLLPALAGAAMYLPGILSGAAYSSRTFGLEERLWTQAHILWHYLAWIVLPPPGGLSFHHDAFPVATGLLTPWTTLPAVSGLLGLAGGAVLLRKRLPVVSLGVLWFFIMHLLVSSIFPLELVFEHRNYLPSVGILLALFGLVLHGAPASALAGVRSLLVLALIGFYGFVCVLRVGEWSDPLRQAYFEANRQSDSPRAQHALGLVLSVLAPGPQSGQFEEAMKRFELAAALPGSTLSPLQALLFEHGRHGLPADGRWWEQMREYVRTRPLSAQDLSALGRLLEAHLTGVIRLDRAELGELLRQTWLHNLSSSRVVAMYARFLFNVEGDAIRAGKLLQRSVALSPRSAVRWSELIHFQLLTGQYAEARAGLERLRELNRLRILDRTILDFESRLALAGIAADASRGGR
ncbi:MAG: tetratricopeptide repeat protein [Zoogloeaceae bacterium]|nr:tetratricopeptide repeat protein [Zoogloeaceae bacterium]